MKMSNELLAEKFGRGDIEGTGSNMFIEGDTIYSYGHHYKIAIRLNPDQAIASSVKYVYNPDRYSPTTNKHQAYVRRNLPSYIAIPNCNIEEKFLKTYVDDLRSEIDIIKAKQAKLTEKGTRYNQYESKINDAKERFREVEGFKISLYGGNGVDFIKNAHLK